MRFTLDKGHFITGVTMKNRDYHLYLTDTEYSRIVAELINPKNDLIAQGRYTDRVDDVLCKVTS